MWSDPNLCKCKFCYSQRTLQYNNEELWKIIFTWSFERIKKNVISITKFMIVTAFCVIINSKVKLYYQHSSITAPKAESNLLTAIITDGREKFREVFITLFKRSHLILRKNYNDSFRFGISEQWQWIQIQEKWPEELDLKKNVTNS